MPTVFVEKWSFPAQVDARCTGRSDRQVYGTKKADAARAYVCFS